MKRKLNMGMVGSLRDAFVGRVHRMAARLDAEIELVAGAFSADSEKAKRFGEDLLLNSQRVYRDYQTMAEAEAKLPIGRRIDFVSIVTPNHLHFPVAKLFLEAGINVVCDKPMTFDPDAPRQVLRRGKAYLTRNLASCATPGRRN
jgi:predicted dehydrogenase